MSEERVVEALVVLDVISTFDHSGGDRLLASMRESAAPLRTALEHARSAQIDVIYVIDAQGTWDGDAPGRVREALAGPGGDVVAAIAPAPGEPFLFKPRYSGLDGTALKHVLAERGVTRLILAGAATEMCVAQTAIDARESGLQVSVLRDACARVDERNEQIAIDYLEQVTGSVILTAAEWAWARSRQPRAS